MNSKQLEMIETLTFGPSDFHCVLNADSDSGYQFGNGYAYGMNNQPYAIVSRITDDMIAFIPTDAGEAFAACEWFQQFNETGKTDRNAQTLAAREARKMPSGNISREITIQGTIELMERIKAMSSIERGEAIHRGTIEFPWDELDRLRRFESEAIEKARILLGQ